MRVVRGRKETVDADREVTHNLLSSGADGEPAVRVWRPHQRVAFGRRDRQRDGYERAQTHASERGFVPVERDVGGRAVATDGETTLAFARIEPVTEYRRGTTDRYERALAAVERALSDLAGLEPVRGEPDDSFCPGTHSISLACDGASNRKVVGIAQRVRQDVAVVAGVVLVANRDALAAVLESVYDALDLSFDPNSVGTIGAAGGPTDPFVVQEALEDALVGDSWGAATIESVR